MTDTSKPFQIGDEVWYLIPDNERTTSDDIIQPKRDLIESTRLERGIVKRILRNGNDWAIGIIVNGDDSYEQIVCERFCAHRPNMLIGLINSAISRARVDLAVAELILEQAKRDHPDMKVDWNYSSGD